MQLDDGGRAFPCEQGHTPDGTWNQSYEPGMSLRDYFAAHAPTPPSAWYAACRDKATKQGSEPWVFDPVDALIEWRWHYADAMIAARAKALYMRTG